MNDLLLETRRALAQAKAERAAREASARAPLVEAQQQLAAVQAETAALQERIEAFKREQATARERRPIGDMTTPVVRLLCGLPVFIAAAVSLPDSGTVQVMIAGLVLACVAVVRGIGD